MKRFLRNLTAYVTFEMAGTIAAILGVIALLSFPGRRVRVLSVLTDDVPPAVNLLISLALELAVSLVPGYAAVGVGRFSE